jgi:hypothetical protein
MDLNELVRGLDSSGLEKSVVGTAKTFVNTVMNGLYKSWEIS